MKIEILILHLPVPANLGQHTTGTQLGNGCLTLTGFQKNLPTMMTDFVCQRLGLVNQLSQISDGNLVNVKVQSHMVFARILVS